MEWLLPLLFILLAFSAFFSSSEIAFFSLSKEKVRTWRRSPHEGQRSVYELLTRSRDLLVLIFFLNTVVNILIQNTMSSLLGSLQTALWLKIVVPFFLVLFFGEYIPKYIGLQCSQQLALFSADTYLFLKKKLEKPLQWMTSVAETISSVLFFFLKPEPPMTEKDLTNILETSQTLELLTHNEASLIRQVIDLKASTVDDATLPINEFSKVNKYDIAVQPLLEVYKKSPHHLVLITESPSEEIIGVIESSLLCYSMKEKEIAHVLEQSKKLLSFVPKTMRLDRLLSHFDHTKTTYAAVYDEHGKILGITSQNILLSKLLPPTSKTSLHTDESHLFPGTTPIETINALFHIHITSLHDLKTIGGWLVEIFDSVPAVGTTYLFENLLFRVLATDEKTILQLQIQKVSQQEASL